LHWSAPQPKVICTYSRLLSVSGAPRDQRGMRTRAGLAAGERAAPRRCPPGAAPLLLRELLVSVLLATRRFTCAAVYGAVPAPARHASRALLWPQRRWVVPRAMDARAPRARKAAPASSPSPCATRDGRPGTTRSQSRAPPRRPPRVPPSALFVRCSWHARRAPKRVRHCPARRACSP
jgi:hypothetical protein